MHFMSIEVSAQSFLFPPRQTSDAEVEVRGIEQQGAMQKNEPAERPFAHIHLHDLESLWWGAVWIVFYNEFRAPQQSDADAYPYLQDIDRQVALAQNLFPPLMESTRRRDRFQLHFHKIFRVYQSPSTLHVNTSMFFDAIILCITRRLKHHCLIPLTCSLSRTIYTTLSGEFLDRRRHWNSPSLLFRISAEN